MDRFFARIAISSAAFLIAGAGACVMLIFLVFAFYLFLARSMPDWAAALSTAGAALVFSILVMVIARLLTRNRVTPAERARQKSAAELGEILGRQAHRLVSTNSPALLGGLLAVGFALGFSPKLRKILMKLL